MTEHFVIIYLSSLKIVNKDDNNKMHHHHITRINKADGNRVHHNNAVNTADNRVHHEDIAISKTAEIECNFTVILYV